MSERVDIKTVLIDYLQSCLSLLSADDVEVVKFGDLSVSAGVTKGKSIDDPDSRFTACRYDGRYAFNIGRVEFYSSSRDQSGELLPGATSLPLV